MVMANDFLGVFQRMFDKPIQCRLIVKAPPIHLIYAYSLNLTI